MAAPTVEALLRARIGLDPATLGPGLIDRAIRARLNARGLSASDLASYVANLDTTEFDALVEEVVIPETWFFRDTQPFALVADRLATETTEVRRILCVPCATGEEPYSVAMALLDRGLRPDQFRVLGIDLSRRALAAARRRIYSDNAFRGRDRSFRDRYFRVSDAGYVLNPVVAGTVEFRAGNLVDPAFLADEAPFDAVFCRNLLIYLDDDARRAALRHLERLVAARGLLFVGHAENLGPIAPRFQPAGPTYCFAFERVLPGAGLPAVREPSALPMPISALPPRPLTPKPPIPRPTVPPKVSITVDPPAEPPTFERAATLADQGRHDDAAAMCEMLIEQSKPTAPLLFLLGTIRLAQGDRARAERCFEKSVYLDPNHHEALLSLSAAARRRGDEASAMNYLRRARRAAGEEAPR